MLPLSLTSMEEYFFVDDTAAYPTVFYLKLELRGPVCRRRAERALAQVVSRHLLLQTRIECDRRGRPRWIESETVPEINWVPMNSDVSDPWARLSFPPLDISTGPTVRVHFVETARGHDAVFQVHHTAFDGMGVIQFVQDWLAAYQSAITSEQGRPELVAYDSSLLSRRCQPGLSFHQWRMLLPGQWKSVRAAIEFINRKAIPIVPMELERDLALDYQAQLNVVTRKLSESETESLRELANLKETTVNNILTRDLFIAIDRWQTRLQVPRDGSHIRIMIPVNERTAAYQGMPACNHCTMVNFERRVDEIQDPEKLHSGIRQEMNVIRKWRLSLNFWRALSLFRQLPGGLKKQTQIGKCAATCVLTNLGNLDRWFPGQETPSKLDDRRLAIDDVDVVAPLRPGTYAAFSVYYFKKQLHLTLRYDGRIIPRAQAEGLNEIFFGQIQDSLRL